MADGISLIIIKGAQGYDVTELTQKVTWRGRKGSSSRSLTAVLIDDDGEMHARSGIDVEQGHQCIFSYNDTELFRGIIMSQTQTQKKTLQFTAYDNGIYLANNKDTFTYENKTASDIFRDVCKRFGLPTGEVAECSYKIPELTKSKTTAFDTIADALGLDYKATGTRHYISSDKGKLSLITRRENIMQWVIETGANLSTYSYTRSIEGIKTRVKILSKEGTTLAEKSESSLESKIGVFQEVETVDDSYTTAQINDIISSVLKAESAPSKTMNVKAMGIADVISGIGVFIVIPELDISRTFYVDEDTHIFEDNLHTMTLKLNFADDVEYSSNYKSKDKKDSGGGSGGYKVGSKVNFKGGAYYISSSSNTPVVTSCPAGPAKITSIAEGAKHPYHLVSTDSSTYVHGWVNAGQFS